MSTHFFTEDAYCSNYLLNRIPTGVVSSMTIVERWCGKNPSVSHPRVYGYVAWAHIPNDCKNKLDTNIHACIMMGYSEESTTYRLFDYVKQQIIMKRNVFFYEKSLGINLLNASSS